MNIYRSKAYPIGDNKHLRAIELWLIMQQFLYQHASEVSVAGLSRFEELFDHYWAACGTLGMVIGENHPLDVLDSL